MEKSQKILSISVVSYIIKIVKNGAVKKVPFYEKGVENMEKLRKSKTLGLIGNLIIIISLFCTWFYASSESTGLKQSTQFIHGTDGKVALVLSILSIIIIYSKKLNVKLSLISSIIQLAMIINVIYQVIHVDLQQTDIVWHFGIGFYLMCIGVAICCIYPFIYKKDTEEEYIRGIKNEE